ncbi:MAG: CDP-glycerol glycerophosphotransferase family protein [Deltaproteobacteria bacterium]|nr:CDP-glycerol glycerophosphotransferase family protein [Deltaproteobacteria bacterium]
MSEPQKKFRLGIPLLGKGATTHLHRKMLIQAIQKKGVEVCFLVREDYADLLEPIPGCHYITYHPPEVSGRISQKILDFCQSMRRLYPRKDLFRKWQYRTLSKSNPSLLGKLFHGFQHRMAGSKQIMKFFGFIEGLIYRSIESKTHDSFLLDQLLVLGVGSPIDSLSLPITWWGLKKGIPVVHFVGNYDSLSSNGFRGHPIKKVLVWGPNMLRDARDLHGIPEERIQVIGSIRYNDLDSRKKQPREEFFKQRGLKATAKTLTFAGFFFEFHYFEIISVFKQLKKTIENLQLILRIYPNKRLLRSPFMELLIEHTENMKDIYISLADPFYRKGEKDRVVLQIEEEELWDILNYSDVLVNVFSTIAVEASIFDKPVINMWYFQKTRGLLKEPVYLDYPLQWHLQRLMSYGAIKTAVNQEELMNLIRDALLNPPACREERKKMVEEECGLLDGQAAERLVACCLGQT